MSESENKVPLYWSSLLPQAPILTAWTSRKIGLESMCQKLNFNGPVFRMNQVHGTNIVEINPDSPRVIDGADALVTQFKGLGLVVKTADCVPLMIWNDVGWGAVVHAGRRGTQQGITLQTLKWIEHQTHATGRYQVWIGPHICAQCYEINPDTHETYDMLSENRRQIMAALPANRVQIEVFDGCTAQELDRFFSYRKEADQAGRMFGLLVL